MSLAGFGQKAGHRAAEKPGKIRVAFGRAQGRVAGMNRRDFLLKTSLAAAVGLAVRRPLSAQSASPIKPPAPPPSAGKAPAAFTEFRPLRRDVGIFTGRGGTIGWLETPRECVVVDTQYPDTAALFLEGLPGLGRRTIDVVLNTHHHFDHTGGNPVFKPASRTIVAQQNVPGLQFAAAERAGTVTDQVYADTTFSEVWRHELASGEIVTAQYFGPAHTGGDAVMSFEKANVVHMGDLVFNRLYPVVDRPGGASIRGWIAALGQALELYPRDAIYVYGHGRRESGVTGTQADLRWMRGYLTALLERVQRDIQAGKTKEQIAALDSLPGYAELRTPGPNRLQGNLEAAYEELTQKKA